MFDDAAHLKSPIGDSALKRDRTLDNAVGGFGAQPEGKKAHPLDAPEMVALQQRLMSYYENELNRQAENRIAMARDEDYYDNEQWSEEEKRILKERGQAPLVYNVISSAINWVLGSEKRGRSDFKVLPRRKDGSKPAERKSQLLKYLADVNRSQFNHSRAFEDAIKAGIGWIECGYQDGDDGEPVYDRYESWRNMLWDSTCTEKDLGDARYVIRTKWVDLDIATAIFPDRAGAVARGAVDGSALGSDLQDGDEAMDAMEEGLHSSSALTSTLSGQYERRRVRLIEVWFRTPKKVKKLSGGDFAGEIYDPESPAHADAMAAGAAIVEKVMMRIHVAIMTTSALLYLGESPYRHNRFPFTPIWAYRRARSGLPYGMINGMVGLQDDINKRASKALHILSANKVIMDEGAVPNLASFREEVARPDGILVKAKGYELTLNAERELAPAHLELMSRSIQQVQTQSGVTDELMGRSTNAKSGVAIEARQQQGSMATAGLFDNLRFAKQVHGEKQLAMIEQFFTEEKSFRITNMRGTPEYVTINDGLPDNDIVREKADYVISEADWRASVRQAQTEELLKLLMQLAPAAPQVVMVMLDLIVEGMDVPSREELVRRIRQVTGMRDPDAEQPTQEEIARAQQEAEQAAMQKAAMEAEIADKQASAAQKQAMAEKAKVDAQSVLATMAGTNVNSQVAALQAALQMLAAPAAVPVADGVLHESGFVSRTEGEVRAVDQAAKQHVLQQAQAEMAAQQQDAQAQAATQATQGSEQAPTAANPMGAQNGPGSPQAGAAGGGAPPV